MNRNKFTLTVLALVICAFSFAQEELSAKEKKKLQKEMLAKAKDMDPVELQTMFDEYPNLSSEVSNLTSELSTKEEEVNSLQADLNDANAKIEELNASTASYDSSSSTDEDMDGGEKVSQTTGQTISGLVYKVQIGAFRNKDLIKYFNNNSNFGGEVDQDGTQKYSIGQFHEYWEADTFKKYMREMGVKDAWIVPYYNGKRITMKDAREGVF